jgi:erythromycin esterase-like protein
MENDWGSSQLLDSYINGGPGNLKTIMTKALFGSWQTQEYEGLFAWLRAYNAHSAHPATIHFLGMDLQEFDQGDFDTVENYIQKVDPKLSTQIDDLYKPLIANGIGSRSISTYSRLDASTKQQYQDQAQQVYNLLQSSQQRYSNASLPDPQPGRFTNQTSGELYYLLYAAQISQACSQYTHEKAGSNTPESSASTKGR